MDNLLVSYHNILSNIDIRFSRTMDIDWNDKLIGLTGARGVGKTTYLIKHIKENLKDAKPIYISLDDLAFANNSILDVADEWLKRGGTHLILDEIHKYPNWSQELKNIYDQLKPLRVIFTGSSLLEINKGKVDLSRRSVIYTMKGLSFREYLNIETENKFKAIPLEDLLTNHVEISKEIVSKVKPYAYFDDYLKHGYYPYYLESKNSYSRKLLNTLNLILEVDLPYLRHVEVKYIHKLKKLINMVAASVPFQPNVSKIAADIEVSRHTIMLYLNYLEDSRIFNLLLSKSSGDKMLAKPEKIYLHHPNLMYAISPSTVNKGNLRESFFYNQVGNIHKVNAAKRGDFKVDEKYTFEIGGKNKSNEQILNIENSFIAADMIECGFENKIPLWLFGFLY